MNQSGAYLAEIGRAIGTTGTRVSEFLRRSGETRKFPYTQKKEKCNQWKGGRHVDKDGYVLLYAPDHPLPRRNEVYVLEHRLVMENHLGRYLTTKEVVHHKDKNKLNNQIENLELFGCNADHLRKELSGHCPKWTPEGLEKLKQAIARSVKTRQERSRIRKEQGGPASLGRYCHRPPQPDKASPALLGTALPPSTAPVVFAPSA